MTLDPVREWRQMFDEAWRMERDYYYEPDMHGLDWPAMREKYGRLIDRATCRQDVRFVIGELIGELNTSHTYVYGGDRRRRAEPVGVGMLGADWEATDGRWRIARILRTPEWTRETLPPLVRPGLDVREGDYLLAVDGVEVTTERNVYSYFVDAAGRRVTLTLNDRPGTKGAREAVVVPIGSEFMLRYMDWVESNRRLVDEMSGGEIGYLHFPDTYLGTAREFGRQFYGQLRKKGLIVDGRHNSGGLDPDIFLQRLDKGIHSYWTRRHSHDQTAPATATRAHLACLTNRQAGSGGDELPSVFRWRGMGPVIGTRTWGGLVGVSMFLRLIDGGGLTAPDYRIYNPEGEWIIEGEGVRPDIEVELDNAAMFRGEDAQLRRAVQYLQEKIAAEPRPWPQHPPYPAQR
jgi:tricorn protease